jgi:hypothetical protein
MKKFIYLLMGLSLVFTTACDPMDDIYAEIDAQQEVINGEVTFTLTDDDYDDLDLTYGNFSSVDDAKAMIPTLLVDKYPVWGDGSLATVTFKLYNPMSAPSKNIYELSDAEHNAITGKTYGNFDRDYQIFDYLEATFPSPSEGDFHSLRYRFYAGGESTLTDGFSFENGEWNKITGFTEDEYKAMGESYPNFSSHDEAALKIPLALPDIFKFDPKDPGEIVQAMYELYKGGGVTKSYVANFVFDGTSWSKYNNVSNETIKFGHDGSVWVPDNTIKYTLTSADYDLVGNGYYGNFDVRGGKAEAEVSVRLEKINTILLNNFPGMAEGQKFVISYNVYSGANEVWDMKVILTGGVYVLQ